jgi:hypothetical protein
VRGVMVRVKVAVVTRLRCYWLGLRYGIWPQWLVRLRYQAYFRLMLGGTIWLY